MESNEVLANRISELTRKNSELKAQVEQLRVAATIVLNARDKDGITTSGLLAKFDELSKALSFLPSECLAEIKAQAVDEHTKLLVESIMAIPVPTVNEHTNTRMRDVLVNVINHANKIRQQAKAGE